VSLRQINRSFKTAAADLRQFAAVEAGQHDGTAGMAGGGGDEAVEQAGVFDLVAAAERFDDALNMATALADVLDEVEVLVAADLLDTDEHGWCPGSPMDTMANPRESSPLAGFFDGGTLYLAPQFCRDPRKPRYSAGFQTEPGANCGSWV